VDLRHGSPRVGILGCSTNPESWLRNVRLRDRLVEQVMQVSPQCG
jgi:hypothetical protein